MFGHVISKTLVKQRCKYELNNSDCLESSCLRSMATASMARGLGDWLRAHIAYTVLSSALYPVGVSFAKTTEAKQGLLVGGAM
jgi:hypothetical protein